MKVLHLIHDFLTPTMTFIYNEVTDLNEHVDVTVCCVNRREEKKYPFKNIEILKTGLKGERLMNFLKRKITNKPSSYWPSAKKELERVVKSIQPDIIHCQFGTSLLFLKQHIDTGNIPIVVSFHGFDASAMLEKPRYVRQMDRYMDGFVYPIFVSHDMKRRFAGKGIGFQNDNILYYGTDISFFERTNYQKPDRFTFLQVSSFTEKKGHKYTLRAFAELLLKLSDSVKPKLILGGDGPLKGEIIDEIERLSIKDYVELPGLLDNKQVKEYMEEVSCFVHHSVTSSVGSKEGIPNVIMESMAMELPVLSTYHSGIPELVENGINGYLVTERDVEAYTESMMQIMNWEYKPENRQKVQELFEKKKRTQKLVDIYNTVMKNG